MPPYLTLDDLALADRRVLIRSDLNVPLEGATVADDFRIRSALPTIAHVREAGAVTVVCSHLGRPKGQVVEDLRMAPVAARLSELGGFPVQMATGVVGAEVEDLVANASAGDVILLENTRFEAGETANDPNLADALAGLADEFIHDAFGTAHRAHASTVGVAERLRSAAGPLLVREIEGLGTLLSDPPRPFTVVLGGAKISDKLPVIEALLPLVDSMLVGGGMCFTLLAAEGFEIGDSLVEPDQVEPLTELMRSEYGDRLVLPRDVVVGDRFAEDAVFETVGVGSMQPGWMGLDIGPETAERFSHTVRGSGSVFWNGPMGVFEWRPFRAGTEAVAAAMAACEGFTVAGGGDSVAALRSLSLEDALSHMSTGGGAGLELLEGRTLPAVAALERWTE